ncbi:hypothetical protein Tco_0148933 [Tanacetum coccineum]
MATMAENVIAAENGEMLRDSVENGPYKFKSEITVKDTISVTDIRRAQRLEDLAGDDKLRYDNDMKAVNILLLGLPVDIYTLIKHYQTLYAFLKHIERDAKEVQEMRQRFTEPLALLENTYNPPPSYSIVQQPSIFQPNTGLVIPTFLPTDDPIASLNKAMIFLSLVYHSKFPPTNNQLRTSSNPITQATIQNGQVTVQNVQGHMAKQYTIRKRVKDSEWFKENMLLAQTKESGVVLNDEQHDFLADSLEETDDNYDDEATANAIFMANLSLVGSLNDDTVTPRYKNDALSKLYDELKGNNDVISYTDYMLTIGNDEDNYVPPPVQKNDMMLSVIEQMKSQVEKCNMVNQEAKSVNESLTSELERYKNIVRVLEYAVKDGHYEQEAYLKQLYWSSIPSHSVNVSKPKVFPKKLPLTSQVLRNLNKARDLFTKFDECIKRRTMLSPHEIVSWEQSDIKGTFKADVIPFSKNLKETFKFFKKGFIAEVKEMKDIFEQIEDEIDQCFVAKKSFQIEKKQLLIHNDWLLE